MMDLFPEIRKRMIIYDIYEKWRRGWRWVPAQLRPTFFRLAAKRRVSREVNDG